jgi:hypothetical protein
MVKGVWAQKEILHPETEFMSAKKTLKTISEKSYFVPNESPDSPPVYPEALKELIEDGMLCIELRVTYPVILNNL